MHFFGEYSHIRNQRRKYVGKNRPESCSKSPHCGWKKLGSVWKDMSWKEASNDAYKYFGLTEQHFLPATTIPNKSKASSDRKNDAIKINKEEQKRTDDIKKLSILRLENGSTHKKLTRPIIFPSNTTYSFVE